MVVGEGDGTIYLRDGGGCLRLWIRFLVVEVLTGWSVRFCPMNETLGAGIIFIFERGDL